MSRTRIGFVGTGGIAERHKGVLSQFNDVAIVAATDLDADRAAGFVGSGGEAYGDVSTMLDRAALDAVFICVPPFAHGDAEMAAVERGMPFFVEKPVGLDEAMASKVASAVGERGVITAVGYHWRYLDYLDEVREIVTKRPIQLMSGYFLDETPPPRWWWRQDRSGGQMVEQTTHQLDLARALAGDAIDVFGRANHLARERFPDLDVATASTASISFASGAIGNFTSTALLDWRQRAALHLFGEGYAIEISDVDIVIDIGRGRQQRGGADDPVRREDRDFIDAVQGKANRIRCPYAEGLASLRLSLAIGRSAASGDVIRLERAHG